MQVTIFNQRHVTDVVDVMVAQSYLSSWWLLKSQELAKSVRLYSEDFWQLFSSICSAD